jgi:hypothetical protein
MTVGNMETLLSNMVNDFVSFFLRFTSVLQGKRAVESVITPYECCHCFVSYNI